MRTASAIITVAAGRGGTRQFPVQRVQSYATTQSVDNDADSFSLDIGDGDNLFASCLERDNEVRVALFLSDLLGRPQQIFTGITDVAMRTEDFTLSITGRDVPSSLAVDSDALPGRWRKFDPKNLIASRAHALGISNVRIANMSQIMSTYTDGSEKEWSLWYRLARMKGMYMWSDSLGTLIIDKLGYSLTPSYMIGSPPKGHQSDIGWIPVEAMHETSTKQTRIRTAIVYGMKGGKAASKKKSKTEAMVAQGIDVSIDSWRKHPTTVMTSTKAKNQADLKKEADDEIFESIVGANEIQVTVQDAGIVIEQNKMAYVNMPDYNLSGIYYVVGVQRSGSPKGLVQVVRLREKGFALTKRVPTAPALLKSDAATDKPAASLAAALTSEGIRWSDSFVRATNEFGVPAGWDFAVFCGVLLSICQKETGFANVRQTHPGALNHEEWQSYTDWLNSGSRLTSKEHAANLEVLYQQTFANAIGNVFNPFYPSGEAGVGPMQLTSIGYKVWADQYGWLGSAKPGEYDGGRWNPDSNIRAAARALVAKLKASPPADPLNANSIWIGVTRYNGSTEYSTAVKKLYDGRFKGIATSAVAVAKSIPANSTDTSLPIPGHGVLTLPADTPSEVRKAINFCLRRLGDPYQYGGSGPYYDCSSLVTAALASGAAYLRGLLDEPTPGHHGETTYTLFQHKRFASVRQDQLMPGDLVFFRGDPPEHMGMYLDEGLFIQDPSPGKSVSVASMSDDYYARNYSGARRLAAWPSLSPGPR